MSLTSLSPFSFVILWFFVLLLGASTALMEIQIEGGNGWAASLPSWRLAPKWFGSLLNGKDVTGYHIYLGIHTIVFFHLPAILFGWSWITELTIICMLCSYTVVEDVLWFIFNPHYGWKAFKKGKVAWYKNWWGRFPVEYYGYLFVAGICALLRGSLAGSVGTKSLQGLSLPTQQLIGWAAGLVVTIVLVMMMVAVCQPRIDAYQKKDTKPHPGHPGFGVLWKMKMPKMPSLKRITSKAKIVKKASGKKKKK